MSKKVLHYLFTTFLTIIFSLSAYGGTTGKIAGRIIDFNTKEPIPGVNVIIEETNLGAATNIEGWYVINNIPPGIYTITVSAVGYQKKQITNIKVSTDFTTKLNVELAEESVTLQTIVVEAESPLIRTDLTSSQSTIDATQIEALPVESMSQILRLQAGIVQGVGGELHIRGGRSNEIAYTVNGVSISNPFDNSVSVQIAKNAIQELSVISGTFNAEYGNALSGVVNTVTKEGGEKYSGQISFYTGDHLSNRTDKFFNIGKADVLNSYVGELTLGGPIPQLNNKLSFFLSGRYEDEKGWLYGVREHRPTDSVYVNPLNPNDIRIAKTGDDAIVSMNPSREFSGTVKLTFKPVSTVKINYDVLYSKSYYQIYSHDFKFNPDANYNNYEWGLVNSLDFKHALSATTFYSLKASYNVNDFKQYLYPLLKVSGNDTSEVDFYPGMDMTNIIADPRYQPEEKLRVPGPYSFYYGGTRNGHFYERAKTSAVRFDFTSQVTLNHEIKFGLEGKYHELLYQSFTVKRDTVRYHTPTIPALNSLDHDRYSRFPIELSAYLQDKMEFDNLVINLGLRYDYFNSQAKYSTNIFYPTPNDPLLPTYIDPNALLTEARPKHQWSPRIGLSFPITDKGIIHFSYGHFHQMPSFQNLYSNPDFKYALGGGQQIYGNANLNPQREVTYEIGLQQQLFDDLAIHVTGFYKDVRDLLALETIRVSGDKTYTKYVNKDYGNIKGITFSLTKRKSKSDRLGVTVDYTFSVSEGNDVSADAFFLDLSSGRQSEKVPIFLSWDQSHTLNATVAIGLGDDWNASIVGRLGSGLPYTPQITQNLVYIRTNSGRRPFFANIDLLGEKTFGIFGYTVALFIKVFNLFDFLMERYVYNDTGRSTYTLIQTSGGTKAIDELAGRIPEVHTAAEYFNRPNYYYPPREVRVGLSFGF